MTGRKFRRQPEQKEAQPNGLENERDLIRPGGLPADPKQMLASLGYSKLTPLASETFDQAIWPTAGQIWIGEIGGCLVITSRGIVDPFFDRQPSVAVQKFFALFPDAEICALTLHSVVNLWGFALFRQGRLVRRKAGSSDDGTFCEEGEPQPEEQEFLSLSHIAADGRRYYRLPDIPDENLPEDAVGEYYVFAFFKRMTGASPAEDENLMAMACQGFAVSSAKRPVWKFW